MLLPSGHIECWGGAEWGELGTGTTSGPDLCEEHSLCDFTPGEVVGITDATQIAASPTTCALLSTGHVECWGRGEDGALGNGSTPRAQDAPVEVANLTDATQVAASESHACALRSGGQIDCWGANTEGQLGNGTLGASDTPVEVEGL